MNLATEFQEFCRRNGWICMKWYIDSETGIEYLFDIHSGDVLAKHVSGKIVNPEGTTSGQQSVGNSD